MDNKTYTMRYHNQQNFNSTTKISNTSGTDKLNAYWKIGDLLPLTHTSTTGILRTGLWWEYASSDRHQTPANPYTWEDTDVPNFHETFGTTTMQPYLEYQWKATSALSITPGIKYAYYRQNFTQFADNGKKIGDLGGAPFVKHAATYTSVLPTIDAHYLVQPYWSVYGQLGRGQNIPPTAVFDVPGANVTTAPKPILADTLQFGSVWKSRRATLDVDYYHINYQNDYSSSYDQQLQQTIYYQAGDSRTQGVEAESTILVGGGVALYLNGTKGSAKYVDSGQWSQNAPSDTETIGVTYNLARWNVGLFSKRIGQYWQDNGSTHQALAIDPFSITNLFVNYTVGGSSMLANSRIRLAVNNLTDSHAVTGVSFASKKSSAPSPDDVLTMMAGRSVSVALTVGVSPK
jgi:iron complex outermembrane receptor protein